MGLTDTIFTFLEKRLSLLIILVKCKSVMFVESLIISVGILSGPIAFLECMSLIILFISSAVSCGKLKVLRFRFA